ncbi:hypothetical protein JCM17843_17530 [Kordiimonadales bacterium JCM 17843]|nr:hypothetical protein JCM17843_17530 [Kordiimonadales bacterium JCM 17843]
MSHPTVKRGIDYLKNLQEDDGSWYGRWGTNYVYGTWSVLSALNAVGVDMNADYVQKAVNWLKARQNDDGGWGESGDSYYEHMKHDPAPSTPSQTAWALLGLMAAGHVEDETTRKGIDFLLAHPRTKDGRWEEPWYNAVGFPRVFYLRYHGYSHFFPVWALSRYRNLTRSNDKSVQWGM